MSGKVEILEKLNWDSAVIPETIDPETEMFVDSSFPPNKTILSLPESDKRFLNDLSDRKIFHRFGRPNALMENQAKPGKRALKACLFEPAGTPIICQGGMCSDHWILSDLAMVRCIRPDILESLVVSSDFGLGKHTFRFYHCGVWKNVTIDDNLPCIDFINAPGKVAGTSFAQNNGSAFWLPLFEKAYAKLYGSYGAIETGLYNAPVVAFTGGVPIKLEMNECESRIRPLIKHVSSGKFLAYAIADSDQSGYVSSNGIISNYGHGILGFVPKPDRKGRISSMDVRKPKSILVKMFAPWERTKYRGKWRRDGACWTSERKEALGFDEDPPGVFYVRLDNFLKEFSVVRGVVLPDTVRHQGSAMGDWSKKSSDGPHGLKSPQFLLDVTEKGRIWFSLQQQDAALLGDTKSRNYAVAIRIFRIADSFTPSSTSPANILPINGDRTAPPPGDQSDGSVLVYETRLFTPSLFLTGDCLPQKLVPGKYIIQASTYKRAQLGTFQLRAIGESDFSLRALPPLSSVLRVTGRLDANNTGILPGKPGLERILRWHLQVTGDEPQLVSAVAALQTQPGTEYLIAITNGIKAKAGEVFGWPKLAPGGPGQLTQVGGHMQASVTHTLSPGVYGLIVMTSSKWDGSISLEIYGNNIDVYEI